MSSVSFSWHAYNPGTSRPCLKLPQPTLQPPTYPVCSIPFASRNTVLEMFRRTLPEGNPRSLLERLANRLTKITSEARQLDRS